MSMMMHGTGHRCCASARRLAASAVLALLVLLPALAAADVEPASSNSEAAAAAAGPEAVPPLPRSSLQEQAAVVAWLAAQRPRCRALFAARRFLSPEEQAAVAAQQRSLAPLPSSRSSSSIAPTSQQRTGSGGWCPALLWTFTGTGNTMTRMLLEVASGWRTGSVYCDLSLLPILPGEVACDNTTIAVKAHPQWHSFASLGPDGFRPDTPGVPPDAKPLCACEYTRAVAVIRDPWATFLAEYKRHRTHQYDRCSGSGTPGGAAATSSSEACVGGHVAVITRDEFNATDFAAEVLRLAAEWAAMFDSYDAFEAAHPGGLFLTSFEALTAPGTRTAALAELLAVLGVPPSSSSSSEPGSAHADGAACAVDAAGGGACSAGAPTSTTDPALQAEYDPERLQCAFEMAAHPSIYRPKDPAGIDAQFVYGSNPDDLVCRVWELVGARAAAHGYGPYGGIQCGSSS